MARNLAAPKKLYAEAARVPDRPEVAIETPWRRSRRLRECPIGRARSEAIETRGLKLEVSVQDSQVQDGQDGKSFGQDVEQGVKQVPERVPERHGPKGGQGAEFPSKFPSGVDRETENPAASTADDKAASYATLRYSRAR